MPCLNPQRDSVNQLLSQIMQARPKAGPSQLASKQEASAETNKGLCCRSRKANDKSSCKKEADVKTKCPRKPRVFAIGEVIFVPDGLMIAEVPEHEGQLSGQRFEISSKWSAPEVYNYICKFFPKLFLWMRNKYGFDDVFNPGFVILEKPFSTLCIAEGGHILLGVQIIAQVQKISAASWRYRHLYLATTHHIPPSVYKDGWNESVPLHISVPIPVPHSPVSTSPSTIVTCANSQVDAFDDHYEGLSSEEEFDGSIDIEAFIGKGKMKARAVNVKGKGKKMLYDTDSDGDNNGDRIKPTKRMKLSGAAIKTKEVIDIDEDDAALDRHELIDMEEEDNMETAEANEDVIPSASFRLLSITPLSSQVAQYSRSEHDTLPATSPSPPRHVQPLKRKHTVSDTEPFMTFQWFSTKIDG
ncbi:hypothetical protein EW145_g1449 [Phellinidium pouzarii]|uniref:Uncharacterized protein n=1 Tax=Phellinidium pouzarii TaxID=167371 RepID=A0A4S4LK27_9AGAM|nr:hypothetical protein EW145_g1449 [Phellinidium pouzarii]